MSANSEVKARTIKTSINLLANAQTKTPKNPKGLILLLHGYSLTGKYIFDKLESSLPKNWAIIAPNGPFPIPIKTEKTEGTQSTFRLGYSWYFYNSETDEYEIPMDGAVEYLSEHWCKGSAFENLPIVIIGYSQGGYLAPFIGLKLKNVKRVLGIACRFLTEELPKNIPFQIDAIHGAKDPVVSAQESLQEHKRLLENGNTGKFILLDTEGHRLSTQVQETVKQTLSDLGL